MYCWTAENLSKASLWNQLLEALQKLFLSATRLLPIEDLPLGTKRHHLQFPCKGEGCQIPTKTC